MYKYERVPMYVAVYCSIVEYSLTFMASSSAISFLSPADAATVAFLGASFTTDAFFANPRVAKVYLR